MRTTLPPDRDRRAAVLYVGLAIFILLAIVTTRAVWRAWQDRAGQARTAAVFALVQQRMPSRPIEAPGAIAWLREQLAGYRQHLPPAQSSVFGRLSDEADFVPDELGPAAAAMREVVSARDGASSRPAFAPISAGGPSRRALSLASVQGATFVVTRRHALEADVSSNGFVSRMLTPMSTARSRLDAALAGIARPVRLYALAEDGTLVSLPWPSPEQADLDPARAEALQLSSRPALPSFAPEEFFFRFTETEQEAVRYSGFYLDLGGRGLVSTLTLPLDGGPQAGVLALDLSHHLDWDHFASTISPPLAATIVHTTASAVPAWTGVQSSFSPSAPASLRAAVADIVRREGTRQGPVSPITHAVVPGTGAVAAFHVSDRAWLLTFFPSATPSFPGGAVTLLAVVLAVLLTGFEVNRRRAEREADRAARALGEKQNLLNTMQVPLVVVDPNTDEIVSANQVAESIGIRRGSRFADRVSADPRARAHYDRTQVATSEARRAYGVPIRVDAPDGQSSDQFAIVRSVAVTAPIEALAADERHRLAILFLVDPQADLHLMLEDVESRAHTDERRRLAGLLSHGLDSLADVLRRSVGSTDDGRLAPWLAEYLQRRIHVIAWLLDHWDQSPPPHDSVVDAAQAHDTIESLQRVFDEARRDADVRARLGWTNGPLSDPRSLHAFSTSIDWPGEFETTLPVRGGLGFVLTEVLANAMRHGSPAEAPRLTIACDRVKKEIEFVVENRCRDDRAPARSRYSGLSLVEGMARLFGWRNWAAHRVSERFVVSWRAPLTRRDQPGKPD
jgi:hypothetical protein